MGKWTRVPQYLVSQIKFIKARQGDLELLTLFHHHQQSVNDIKIIEIIIPPCSYNLN